MLTNRSRRAVAGAALVAFCQGFSITPTTDSDLIFEALFGGTGATSIRTEDDIFPNLQGVFTDGPQRIGDGIVLTSGLAMNALPGRDPLPSSDQGVDGRFIFCLYDGFTFDYTQVSGFVQFPDDVTEITFSYIFSTSEGPNNDTMGIAFDRLLALHHAVEYFDLDGEPSIPRPRSGVSYPRSSELRTVTVPITPGVHEYSFFVCDIGDALRDSAMFLSLKPRRPVPPAPNPTTTTSSTTSLEETSTAPPSTSSATTAESLTSTTSGEQPTTDLSSVTASSSSSVPSPPPTQRFNLPVVRNYRLGGCLSSSAGFPGFFEIGRDELMTTRRCVDLAFGNFDVAGVFNRTCYGSTTSDDQTDRVIQSLCINPCPGNDIHYCGGQLPDGPDLDLRSLAKRQRAIPPSVLLTFYEFSDEIDDMTTTTATVTTASETRDSVKSGVVTATIHPTTTVHLGPGRPISLFDHPSFRGRIYIENVGYCDDRGRCWDEEDGSGESFACEKYSDRCSRKGTANDHDEDGGEMGHKGYGDDGMNGLAEAENRPGSVEGGAPDGTDAVTEAPYEAQPPESTVEEVSDLPQDVDGEERGKEHEADDAAPHVVVSGARSSSVQSFWDMLFSLAWGFGGAVLVLNS